MSLRVGAAGCVSGCGWADKIVLGRPRVSDPRRERTVFGAVSVGGWVGVGVSLVVLLRRIRCSNGKPNFVCFVVGGRLLTKILCVELPRVAFALAVRGRPTGLVCQQAKTGTHQPLTPPAPLGLEVSVTTAGRLPDKLA